MKQTSDEFDRGAIKIERPYRDASKKENTPPRLPAKALATAGLSASKLGRIIFANLLSRPLPAYRKFIEKTLSYCVDRRSHVVCRNRTTYYLRHTTYDLQPTTDDIRTVLGRFILEKNKVLFQYSDPLYCRQCTVDFFDRRHPTDDIRVRHRLRRINSRNELTQRIILGLIHHQGKYLRSGNPADLIPLSQRRLVEYLNFTDGRRTTDDRRKAHASLVYPCWLSRLASHLKVALPNNTIVPLKTLFPSRAACLKVKIRGLLDRENRLMMAPVRVDTSNGVEGAIAAPYTDAQLGALLHEHCAIETTTRHIAALRKSMGIPSARIRSQEFWYPLAPLEAATLTGLAAPFSGIYPLQADKIHAHVPASGGVYEIRVQDQPIVYPKGSSAILYLGRSKNLKKRLLEHSRRHNKNKILGEYVRKQHLTFRFFIIQNDRRHTTDERRLYDLFIATFGAKPKANRVRPG